MRPRLENVPEEELTIYTTTTTLQLLKKRHTSQACAKKHYNLQALRKTPASGETSDEAQKMPRV